MSLIILVTFFNFFFTQFLDSLAFEEVSYDYFNEVMAALGPQLKIVSFRSCKDIDLVRLLSPCALLEDLTICHNCSLIPTEPVDLSLPNLKKLRTAICLGKLSRLFEKKDTLTTLDVHCTHFGVDDVSEVSWPDIPVLWANLKHLSIFNLSPNLNMSVICDIVPQLKNLEFVMLPKEIKSSNEDKELYNQLKIQLESRKKEVRVYFNPSSKHSCCDYYSRV